MTLTVVGPYTFHKRAIFSSMTSSLSGGEGTSGLQSSVWIYRR